jgi:hypothetical protein
LQVAKELCPAAPLEARDKDGFVEVSWLEAADSRDYRFYDVAALRSTYPELSSNDLAELVHLLEPRLLWDVLLESGDVCVVSNCLVARHTPEVHSQLQRCLDFLVRLPPDLPRPAEILRAESQIASERLAEFFAKGKSRKNWRVQARWEVSYALVAVFRLGSDARRLEDELFQFSESVMEIDDATIDWQFCQAWQRVSTRAVDVWDIYVRLAKRHLSSGQRRSLVRWLRGSQLDFGSLVGRMLNEVTQDEFDDFLKVLKRHGPTVPSALPYVFEYLDGPSGMLVVETLKAIDPSGRRSWNLFRDKELSGAEPRERILSMERTLRRAFGAPRK